MGNKMTRDELLASCCSKSEYRPNLQRPFLQGGYVIATDAQSILALPKEDEDTINYIPLAAPDVTPYLNAYCEVFKELKLGELLSEFQRICDEYNKLDCRCSECNGEGKVDWEYTSKSMTTHLIKGECPVCHGEGFVELENYYNRKEYCMMTEGNFGLSIPRVRAIVNTMITFGKDRCMLLRQKVNTVPLYFITEKEFRLVVMPIIIQ